MRGMTIDPDLAHEISLGYDGFVAQQHVSDHRWFTRQLIVFDPREAQLEGEFSDDALYGFFYDEPATELQEGQDVFEDEPVPVYPVKAREITVTKYEVPA